MTTPAQSKPVVKCFWVLDGTSKTFVLRQEIKNQGGYYLADHKAWCIDNPDERTINVLKSSGLVIQFRKWKGGSN